MKKIGIALAGGGARGAYQIGVWKALKEHGIDTKINAYAGASVGSLNALLFAMGDYDLAFETWKGLEERNLFEYSTSTILKRLRNEKLDFLNKGLYNTERLAKLMEDTIDFNLLKDKEVYLSTTLIGDNDSNLLDLVKTNFKHYIQHENRIKYTNICDLGNETIKQIALASCAIPVAFKPIVIGEKTYYDGGILDNIPSLPLLDNNCDLIIVIDLFMFSASRYKLKKSKVEIVEIKPSRSLRGILDFRTKHFERRFALGYENGLKAVEEILSKIKEM